MNRYLTQKEIERITIGMVGQNLFAMKDLDRNQITQIGVVMESYTSLFQSAPMMFRALDTSTKGLEAILPILEAEGLDKAVVSAKEIIEAQKMLMRRVLFGNEALTNAKPNAK